MVRKRSSPSEPGKADPASGFPLGWIALVLVVAGVAWFLISPDFRGAARGDLPVEASFRREPAGKGLTLLLTNKSKRHLSLEAMVKRPRLKQTKTFQLEVPPGATTELGYRQGWSFVSGDTVSLIHESYNAWDGLIE
jgi:hypothetical protein